MSKRNPETNLYTTVRFSPMNLVEGGAYHEARENEHPECNRRRLERNTDKHDGDTNDDCNSATSPIRKPW